MTPEHAAMPRAAADAGGSSAAHDVLSQLRELLAADEAATVIIGIDGTAVERIGNALRHASQMGGEIAVLMIDVDRLRDVNDALGHEIGDRLLASTAKRLATAVRPDDIVARLGGDEFMVLCHDVTDGAVAMDLADRVRRALTGRLTIRQLELDVSVSVGVSISDAELRSAPPDDGAIQMISFADTAVHAAKVAGRAGTAMFTNQLRSNARVRTELAAA